MVITRVARRGIAPVVVVSLMVGCGTQGTGSRTGMAPPPSTSASESATAATSSSRPNPPTHPAVTHARPSTTSVPVRRPSTAASTASPRVVPARPPLAGVVSVPAAGRPVDTSHPDRVIGAGSPVSCTSAAVIAAVAAGGIITFNCGAAPVMITLAATAKVRNTSARVVLDGGGRVTLSGAGVRRILYMDTCDPGQLFTTSHCQNQSGPQLTVQNLTFIDGNSTGQTFDGGGGGAVFVRGGRVSIVNSQFLRNRCDPTGPDVGGAALRVLSQFNGQPVYVVGSTFSGGACSNGGALSSIGVSWVIFNSVFSGNQAIGRGANPAQSGTPGGGSGGALYTDGNTYTVSIAGTLIADNHANAGGGAIEYVSNDRTGTLAIGHSTLRHNVNDGFHTAGLPGIFFLGARPPAIRNSNLS